VVLENEISSPAVIVIGKVVNEIVAPGSIVPEAVNQVIMSVNF
jgi:siroheme synthase